MLLFCGTQYEMSMLLTNIMITYYEYDEL